MRIFYQNQVTFHLAAIMPTATVVKFLEIVFQFGNLAYSLVPICVTSTGALAVDQKSRSTSRKFWLAFWNITMLLTIIKLKWSLHSGNSTNTVLFFYHVFHLIIEFGTFGTLLMLHDKPLEFCQLFNHLCQNRTGLVSQRLLNTKVSKKPWIKRNLFPLLLACMYFFAFLLYCLVLPISLSLFLKSDCTNQSTVLGWIGKMKLLAYIIFKIPIPMSGATAAVLAFAALNEIQTNLLQLKMLVQISLNNQQLQPTACVHFRQMQVLMTFANACFQKHFWPTVMFCGSAAIISMLFPLLALRGLLPQLFLLGFAGFAVLVGIVAIFLLDQCSHPVVISGKVLKLSQRWECNLYYKKFFKSCPPMTLRAGELHVMDKGRVAAFIRFVIQRTVFLVMKYKPEHQYL